MHKQIVSTDQAPGAIGPYSQAVMAEGRFLFLSGQIPLRPDGTLVEGDVRTQTEQVVKNLRAVLDAAGLTPANLVKTTIFLIDMADFATVNALYGEKFASDPPARATVEAARLPTDARVEIDAIAVV